MTGYLSYGFHQKERLSLELAVKEDKVKLIRYLEAT